LNRRPREPPFGRSEEWKNLFAPAGNCASIPRLSPYTTLDGS
jgi:hypothetical protein